MPTANQDASTLKNSRVIDAIRMENKAVAAAKKAKKNQKKREKKQAKAEAAAAAKAEAEAEAAAAAEAEAKAAAMEARFQLETRRNKISQVLQKRYGFPGRTYSLFGEEATKNGR